MNNFSEISEKNKIKSYKLENNNGISLKILNLGATLSELMVPDKYGKKEDIVLGFEDYNCYLNNLPYFGCLVGRYANRIAKGKFKVEEKEYQLEINNGPNHLHGGKAGFNKKFWQLFESGNNSNNTLTFKYHSPDMEEGYPGNLNGEISYTLTNQNELILNYKATTDRITPLNLTNHTYFNLSGSKNSTILDHELQLSAEYYTPVDENLIPTGEIKSVKNTPMDFLKPVPIGNRFDQLHQQPVGYDHNFVLKTVLDKSLIKAALVFHKKSGRVLEVYTNKPGVQFYTGNFLSGTITGKNNTPYRQYSGFCLETQFFPDSPNQENFPSPFLKPSEIYEYQTTYKFLTLS